MSDEIEPRPLDESFGPFDGYEVRFFDGPEPEVLVTLSGAGDADDFVWPLHPDDAMRMGEALIEVATEAGADSRSED